MKKIFLSHMSAYQAIRELRISPRYNSSYDKFVFEPSNARYYQQASGSIKIFNSITIPFSFVEEFNRPIDVLFPKKNNRTKTKQIKHHVLNSNLPGSLFTKINDKLYITGPELTFYLLANILTFEELVMFGYELCGTYVITSDSSIDLTIEDKGFLGNCLPATTTKKLKAVEKIITHNKSKNFRNFLKAKDAITCIVDNSASPRESLISAMLHGPRKYGMFMQQGYFLNYKVEFSLAAQRIANQKFAYIDICNPSDNLAIEYDSRQFHETIEKGQNDKRRLDALICEGWNVISIVPAQVNDYEAFYNIMISILKLTKKRTDITSKDFSIKFHKVLSVLKNVNLEKLYKKYA